jgi:hypothetical protein
LFHRGFHPDSAWARGERSYTTKLALLFIGDIRERLTLVALMAEDYSQTLPFFAEGGAVGGNIYDALLAGCALKADAEILFTWKIRHDAQLGPRIVPLLRTPA